MDREKLIEVSFQIPAGALDSLSRLTEQLRLLAEAAYARSGPAGRRAEAEHMESDSFDAARFQALLENRNEPQTVGAAVSDVEGARAVSARFSEAADADAISASVRKEIPDAAGAGDALDSGERISEKGTANIPQQSVPEKTSLDKIAVVRGEAELPVPNAPETRKEVERPIPEVESVRTAAEEKALALASARGEVSGGIEAPLGAGVVVQTQPEEPQRRWSGVSEELVVPGPAPLTAEAVSLAFERDGRRYDNGFPLY